jgi:non-ribosomal peptide synthetase component F
MTLMAGFKALLMIRSGHSDLCIATTMANRSQPQTEGVIGPFTNTVLIRTRLGPDLSFKEALRRVRESILGAYSKQELPFATLMARLAEEELDVAGFTQVFFGFQNPLRRRLKLHSVTVRPFVHEQSLTMRLDPTLFAVTLGESPSGITGLSICKGASPAPDIMRHWTAAYNAILTKAAADPEAALGRLTE